ncbi:hypothetical protein [Methylobacterium sp. WCS2018Hpa-22]|nr:hypothetical protein [Methylobacterium sp. WCS2018Hpa-22]
MTETETMLNAIDEGYARRTELMEQVGELDVNTPAMLCVIKMLAETDRTI